MFVDFCLFYCTGGRYSLLHDEDAIHEVAVSEDLRASKAVRMGTERARIASVDRGSEDFHSGGMLVFL